MKRTCAIRAIRLLLGLLLLLGIAAGCQQDEPLGEETPAATEPQPAAEPQRPSVGEAPAVPESGNLPARDVLLRGQATPPGFGAYGYVLFTVRPSATTLPRYLAICEAFQGNFEDVGEFSEVDRARLMVTFWPLRSAPANADCPALVRSYDFARATEMARAVGKLGVPGPVLVAWREPFSGRAGAEQEALVLDMSGFRGEDEIIRAFLIWRDRLSRDSSAWKDGFNLVLIRETFRLFLNTYGEQIVAIVRGK